MLDEHLQRAELRQLLTELWIYFDGPQITADIGKVERAYRRLWRVSQSQATASGDTQ
jgi:hypothetical protein